MRKLILAIASAAVALVACAAGYSAPPLQSQPMASPTPVSAFTFTVSASEQNVVAPGTPKLQFTPDEHMPFLRQPDGTYDLWASGGGPFGTYLFHTSDFVALGSPETVFLPAGAGTAAFDADYAGPGSIFPAANSSDLLMIYHGENHLFSGVDYPGTPFYAGIGLARSPDGGLTWTRRGEIISGHDPQQLTQPPTGAGALTPTAIEYDGFIYTIFREIDRQSNVSGYGIARAPISSNGAPGAWQKYFAGTFSTPGIRGQFTPLPIVLDPAVPGDERQPQLSYNVYLHEFHGHDRQWWNLHTDVPGLTPMVAGAPRSCRTCSRYQPGYHGTTQLVPDADQPRSNIRSRDGPDGIPLLCEVSRRPHRKPLHVPARVFDLGKPLARHRPLRSVASKRLMVIDNPY